MPWRALPLAGVCCLGLLLHAGIAAAAEGEAEARNAAMLESFQEALRSLASARREEGEMASLTKKKKSITKRKTPLATADEWKDKTGKLPELVR